MKDHRTYLGYSNDVERRLEEHNTGRSKAIKNRGLFKLVFTEELETCTEAMKREAYWKSGGGRQKLRQLFDGYRKKPTGCGWVVA